LRRDGALFFSAWVAAATRRLLAGELLKLGLRAATVGYDISARI